MSLKKLGIMLLVFLLALAFAVGCAPEAEEPDDPEPANGEDAEPADDEEQLRVGALLPGSIDDMGWNATAYRALQAVEEEFDAEISYVEGVSTADMEEVFRNFAVEGYDIIFGHGFQFGDAAERVAEDFPDTEFVVTSSEITNNENLSSGRVLNEYQGFLAGALAAMLTDNDHVGVMGGVDIPPFRRTTHGFIAGALHVNPDIEYNATLIGTNEDPGVAYEQALAYIDRGADVIFANANEAGLGSIEACQEEGVYAIGANEDQNPFAEDTVVQSVLQDNTQLFLHIVERRLTGEDARFYPIGIAEGGVSLADWHGWDEEYPEVKEEIEDIIEGLQDGSITFDYEDPEYDF